MGLIKVQRRRIRANFLPDFPFAINRKDSIGARVVEYLPLNGSPALVSGVPVTLNTGVVQVGQRGRNLRCPSGYAASIPLNLSKYGALAFAFWAYVDGYSNTDKMFLELTAQGDANAGGFFIDPDSGAAGRFDIVAMGSVAGYNTFNNARPVASWNHYIVEIDLSVAGGFISLALNGVNMPSSGATASTGSPTAFANSTLFIGGRSGNLFSLVGNMQGVTIINGRLTAAEKLALYANSNRVLKPANDSIWIPVSAGGGGTYTLAAASASFSVTGNATGMKAGRQLAAATASFGITGNATALKRGYALPAVQATFAITGNASGLKTARRMTVAPASFSLTGIDATLTYAPLAKILQATSASFTLTGNATGMRLGRRLAASPGVFGLTGQAVTLKTARRMPISAGSYALSGQEVGLIKAGQRILSASTAAFALTGISASLKANRRLLAATGQIVLNGYAAGLRRRYNLAAGTASYAVLGQDAQFGRAYRLPVVCAQFALTGNAVSMLYAPLVTFKMPAARNIYIGKARLTTLPGRDRTLVLD
jgi:hypothetical protein